MSDIGQPTQLLCLCCGNLLSPDEVTDTCPSCGANIDVDELLRLYDYAAHVYYYGHQYRLAYAEQEHSEQRARYSLQFAGEAFAWTMLAVLSGVVGNAAYDLVKVIVTKIRKAVADGKVNDRDYSALLSLSEKELNDLFCSAKSFTNDMDGLTKEVRLAIIEEIAVDAMTHQPQLMAKMTQFMKGKKLGEKKKKKFIELLRATVALQQKRIHPKKGSLNDRWNRIEPR